MLDMKLTLANDDLDTVEAFAREQSEVLAKRMVAAVPTRRTEEATTLYVMLCAMRQQIKEHRALLEEKERAAREARKGKRGK
jgi:hypothetical protein